MQLCFHILRYELAPVLVKALQHPQGHVPNTTSESISTAPTDANQSEQGDVEKSTGL